MTDTTDESGAPEEVVQFSKWLAEHRGGDLDDELGDAIAQVTGAVLATGKKGSVTLKINITSKGRSLMVVDDVTTSIPEADREAAIYFAAPEGHLVRDDPKQQKMPIESVRRDDGTIAEVVRGTGEVVDLRTRTAAIAGGGAPEPDTDPSSDNQGDDQQ